MYRIRRAENVADVLRTSFLQKRWIRDREHRNKLSFLSTLVFASSTSAIFRDGAFSACTVQLENFFMFGEDGSNFAANCLLAKISRKPKSKERLIVLRLSEEMKEATASVG